MLAIAIMACAPSAASAAPPAGLKHVFIVVLENKNFDATFGAHSEAPYLAKTLRAKGNLLSQYHGTGHFSLGNYITMVSGQSENPTTQSDCQSFTGVTPGLMGGDGQAIGSGCVYPAAFRTIANQLESRGLSWRGYMEDMGADPSRESATCAHPALGSSDNTQHATAKDQYATRHNPFVYFHSIIDSPSCARNVVGLGRLTSDLRSAATTPNYSFITPDLCSDGHDETCVNPAQKGGYAGIDGFLKTWAPRIMRSPAYRQGGALIVTFDESESGAEAGGFVPSGPNTPLQGITGPGGGRTGTLVVSPYAKAGSSTAAAYNHYSLLRTTEDVFGLGHLGYAARSEVKPFGADVFNGPGPVSSCTAGSGLRAASARHRGRRGVRFRLGAAAGKRVKVAVYRVSHGRRVTRPRLVASFRRARSFTWKGRANRRGRRVGNGYYIVRFSAAKPAGGTDVRRAALVRRRGGFRALGAFSRKASCGSLASFRLSGPAFGGRGRKRLGIAYRLTRRAKVAVRVTRGRRTVKRFATHTRRAGHTYRLALSPRRLRRGGYRVRIAVRVGGRRLRASLVSRRL